MNWFQMLYDRIKNIPDKMLGVLAVALVFFIYLEFLPIIYQMSWGLLIAIIAIPALALFNIIHLLVIDFGRGLHAGPQYEQPWLRLSYCFLGIITIAYVAYQTKSLNINHNSILLLLYATGTFTIFRWQEFIILHIFAVLLYSSLLWNHVDPVILSVIFFSNCFVAMNIKILITEDNKKRLTNDEFEELNALQKTLKSQVEEDTRNTIARDLHDELGHLSTVINNNLAIYEQQYGSLDSELSNIKQLVKNFHRKVRIKSRVLYQKQFDIISAIQQLQKYITHPTILFECNREDPVLSAAIGEAIFIALQEAIANTIKHSNGNTLRVKLELTSNFCYLTLNDNGTGRTKFKMGNGLQAVQQRINNQAGEVGFQLDSSGFSLSAKIPLEGSAFRGATDEPVSPPTLPSSLALPGGDQNPL